MKQEEEEDEVEKEFPLFACSEQSLFGTKTSDERIRFVNVHYPLRSQIRPYKTPDMKDVYYKRDHRVLSLKVPEDRPDTVC